jgi:L-ascorbate metabolism protein UlaG (beta-lactamase superfamily)
MKTLVKLIILIFLGMVWLISCVSQEETIKQETIVPATQKSDYTQTTQPSATLPAPIETTEVVNMIETVNPPTQASSCITIYFEGNAQVEIINSQGARVLIDVYDPSLLTQSDNEKDILLTTHTHYDHVNEAFLQSFRGEQLFVRTGDITQPGLTIQGIASAHNTEDDPLSEGGTNYIFMIETDGMRIAHFGDIGQNQLTDEQLSQLGRIDVAITQFANSYSNMDATNQKGFKLMEQVNPSLIIPTHINLDAAKIAVQNWQGLATDQPSVHLCKDFLDNQTRILFLGESAEKYASLKLTKVDW